jgi:hypothetical protein
MPVYNLARDDMLPGRLGSALRCQGGAEHERLQGTGGLDTELLRSQPIDERVVTAVPGHRSAPRRVRFGAR